MKFSEKVDKIFPALVKAQAGMVTAAKDADNPYHKTKYADLTAVATAAYPAMHEQGLAVTMLNSMVEKVSIDIINGSGVATVTRLELQCTMLLIHDSTQWIQYNASAPLAKDTPQGYGSTLTYLRRYMLASALGVITDDDDGNAGSGFGGRKTKKTSKPPVVKPAQKKATPAPKTGDKFADLRSQIESSADKGKVTLGNVFTAAVQTKLYKQAIHVLNAAKLHEEMGQYVTGGGVEFKTANALTLFDWLIERKK